MRLSFVPLLAIVFINVIVLGWVIRHRDSTRSGFFLLLNALSLIIWAGGQALYKFVGFEFPGVLSLPYLAMLLVPGNFLYFALTRPVPIREGWRGPWVLCVIFLPALILTVFESYSADMAHLFGYSYRRGELSPEALPQRATLLYVMILVLAGTAVLAVRYYTSSGPEQNTSKHLIATILGPVMFTAFFWAASQSSGPAIVPTPGFLFAVMGQIGLVVVLRQEELQNPRPLSRAIYYIMAILIAFVLMTLLKEFYVFAQGSIVLDRTAGWLLLGCILVLLLVAQLAPLERVFDKLLFTRAAEYRRLVQETRHELKEARERLRKAERLSVVGEISSRMAHEIKNPLGPIRGYTQMMREKLNDDQQFKHRDRFLDYLDIIQEEVESIDRRVRDFLESSREPTLVIEETDVNAIIERCAKVMALEMSGGRDVSGLVLPVNFVARPDPDLEPIQADAGRIEEMVFNLAHNALDALGDRTRGLVVLLCRAASNPSGEPGAEIVVKDNGPGFPMDEMDQYFEPFFTQKRGGTGLGLAIVKATAEAHGGTITLRNRQSGGGEVHLWLPKVPKENPGALLPKPGP